jgi:L-malate glycosyltransferase
MKTKQRKKVTILQKYIPHYRLPFFEMLKNKLDELGIDCSVIYGQPGSKDALKKDSVDLFWGKRVRSKIFSIWGKEFYWQPVFPFLADSDLVIVEQANKLLINYLLAIQYVLGGKKLAYWGHGKNFQAKSTMGLNERFKRLLAKNVSWWFAYNQLSARVVASFGYPEDQISVVQNAIENHQLKAALQNFSPADREVFRRELGITGDQVGLFVGGMYPEKCLDFLLAACFLIREALPGFEMIFIGSGSEAEKIRIPAMNNHWIHDIGPKFGADCVPYYAISNVFLMPGLVGLAILDCFALEIPLVTTDYPNHSPEIDYLENGFNGLFVEANNDPQIYSQAVVSLLLNEEFRKKLIQGCIESQCRYSMENMVDNFAVGVQKALQKS